ncbi:hypothetical protein TRICI_001060 [Trichomonascus ciferrii]|uniref:non-reducing end alpha-L-arabinofuranosidase n=1 Tax=Trichomonascus ciferrii TaxID=44093 RepID=A0A642V9F2_9ASCO|nr:hypothetical protein TRICI_001060 [Trichomonascus ciferrii]
MLKVALLFCFIVGVTSGVTITDSVTNHSSPLLYGLMFEDINRGGDGGLYGEMLNNRAFQGINRSLDNYEALNDSKLKLTDDPLSDALPKSMRVIGDGFYNKGFWGINFKKTGKYIARFYVKGGSNFRVALKGVDSGMEFAATDAKRATEGTKLFPTESNGFQLYVAELVSGQDPPDMNNAMYVTFDGGDATFNFISLMPGDMYKNRENGLRADLAEVLEELSGKFLRFPGGNNLEGHTVARRWKWNETVGPLIQRPGRQGDWKYPNTDGLGLHEYFEWCEDMKLEPILGVYAGYSLGGEEVPEDQLQPYIDEVLNELEYCLGDENTEYGKKRIENGRKDPFKVKYVEIGNEDWFSKHYDHRFPAYKKAINKKYPELVIVASSEVGVVFPKDELVWWDQHIYSNPEWFIDHFDSYDNYPVNNTKVFQGEYGCRYLGHQPGQDPISTPVMKASAAEAVFMLGMERNSNKVSAMCYAPTLENVDGPFGGPNMIQFNPKSVGKSTTYYVHKLLFNTAGDTILGLKDPSFHPLYYTANLDSQSNRVHIKIANPTNQSVDFTASIEVDGYESAKATAQSISLDDPNAANHFGKPEQASISSQDVSYSNGDLKVRVSPYYVGVITLQK